MSGSALGAQSHFARLDGCDACDETDPTAVTIEEMNEMVEGSSQRRVPRGNASASAAGERLAGLSEFRKFNDGHGGFSRSRSSAYPWTCPRLSR